MIGLRNALLACLAALALSGAAGAQSDPPRTPAADEFSEGEVRKIDIDSKKLTLKHGPLKNLEMPGMTMVFQVKDDAMLEKLQVGEKIRFQAEKIDGKFTVTRIEAPARVP